MDFVGSGCEKAKHHLNPSPKRPKTLRNRKQKTGETLPTEPSKWLSSAVDAKEPNTTWIRAQNDQKRYETESRKLAKRCLRNPLKTKTKMALVGSGCEKAKHHLNPSPKRPKTLRNRKQKTGETLPTEPSKDKDKNGSRRQWMRKSQTPPKSEPKTTKNATKPKAENWRNVAYGTL